MRIKVVSPKFKSVSKEEEARAILRMEWITSYLCVAHRFVHVFLRIMRKKITYEVDTMGIKVSSDGYLDLAINPAFLESLSDEQAVWALYHEVNHPALMHCTKRCISHDKMANIAADLAVNELIPSIKGSCERPKGVMLVEDFATHEEFADILPKQTMEWYYNYLKDKCSDIGDELEFYTIDTHKNWDDNEMVSNKIQATIKEIAMGNLWGCLGGIEREIILAAQIKKINWITLIRNWFGSHVTRARESTRKKPHRRFGYAAPGYKRSYRDKWLVAIDTSGSTWGADLLGEFIAVLNQLVDDDIPLDILMFDAAITAQPHTYDRRMDKIEMVGAGGTNFQPVIDIVDKGGYKGVLILTDGEAAIPTRPKIADVLWVLPPGKTAPVDWGTSIVLTRIIH